MILVSIGTDTRVFDGGSGVRKRLEAFATIVDEFHSIVFSKRDSNREFFETKQGLFVYPTNSWARLLMPLCAFVLGVRILKRLRGSGELYVVTQDPFETGIVGAVLAYFFKVPLCVQVHTDTESSEFVKLGFLNRIRRRLAHLTLPRATSIRVVSERLKRSVESSYGIPKNRITVLPVFVNTDAFSEAPASKSYSNFEKTILMVSRLEKEKDIATGIRAFSHIHSTHPNVGLVIVGSGREEEKLKRYTRDLGIDSQVVFEGWRDDTYSYFKAASVYLLTSLYEGYGLVLVEAAGAGCPIVTTDVGVVGELFKNEEHVFVCPVGDAKCLAQKLEVLITDSQKAASLADSAKCAIKNIGPSSYESYAKEFVSIVSGHL